MYVKLCWFNDSRKELQKTGGSLCRAFCQEKTPSPRSCKAYKQALIFNTARRAFHRLREDLRRVEERFVGSSTDDANSARLLAGPLADSLCSRLHTFPRAKKHSCRRVNFEGLLVSLTKFLYLRVKPVLPVFVCRMGWPRVS